MAERADRGLVRNGVAPEIDTGEAPHGFHVIEGFFHTPVAEARTTSGESGSGAFSPALWEDAPFPLSARRVREERKALSKGRSVPFRRERVLVLWVFGISRTKWPSRRFSGASSHLSPLERRSTAEIPRLWNFFYGLKEKTATSARSFSEIPYEVYMEAIARTPLADLRYAAICLFGPSRLVNSLAGALPTLK
jgi:hypothetical protein